MNNKLSRGLRVLIAGGGTGGHLYPALAIAEELKSRCSAHGCEIRLVGTRRGIEYRLRDQLGFPLELISMRGLARNLSLHNLVFPFVLIGALLKSNALLSSFEPDLVVGTGGYVSWPIVTRAAARGIPSAVQEQNSFPGLTTRRLSEKVDRIYLGFSDAKNHLPEKARTLLTGNPIRAEIAQASPEQGYKTFGLDPSKKTILALGGSQGARSINNAICDNLSALNEATQLLWQTGKIDYESLKDKVGKRENVHMFAFSKQIHEAYAVADFAIARAGALTIAELKASGTPAALIPYPFAAGNHQLMNARSTEQRGAATVITDDALSHTRIIEYAEEILQSERLNKMKQALASWNSQEPNTASETIVDDLLALLNEKGISV